MVETFLSKERANGLRRDSALWEALYIFCVDIGWASVDSAWEQKKLEATRSEMLDAKRAARFKAAVPSV